MSNVILSSNSNSALCNTLLASNSLMNPSVYSTKTIYPPSSTTYTEHSPSNGNVPTRSNTTNFQLNKYGIVSQILLTYKKTYTNGSGGDLILGALQNDFFNCVEKVELLSSSRVVSTLTKIDFMAQFSNLPYNKMTIIQENVLKPRDTGTVLNTTPASESEELTFTAPLVFGFMRDINTQLNSSFLEPMSIRITWGKDWNNSLNFATGVVGNIKSPVLSVRYKNYQEDANSQILAENFEKPTLNLLSTRFYEENRQSVLSTAGSATSESIDIELKNTECVQDFYIVLVRTAQGGVGASPTVASDILDPEPQPISSIEFTGSGQEILKLNKEQLGYSKIDVDGFSVGQDPTGSTNKLSNVEKFQTGVYSTAVMSNCISLREINAPKITVKFEVENKTNLMRYYAYVVEDCSAIYSITSATGALSSSLSN